MAEQRIEVGQRWVSRDARDRGRMVMIESADDHLTNGYVTVRSVRRSQMRMSTLRARYTLVAAPVPHPAATDVGDGGGGRGCEAEVLAALPIDGKPHNTRTVVGPAVPDPTMNALSEVLAAHRLYGEDGDDIYECGCGATSPPEALEEDFGELLWHEAHVAALLAEPVAGAWDEGYQARRDEDHQSPGANNPYRENATAVDGE